MKAFRILTKVLVVAGLLAGAGFSVYFYMGKKDALEGLARMTEKYELQKNKSVLLHKKYTEKKVMADGLLRAKTMLEGRNRSMDVKLKEFEVQNAELTEKVNALTAAFSNTSKDSRECSARIARLEKQYERTKAQRDDLSEKYRAASGTVRDLNENVLALNGIIEDLKLGLRRTESSLDRCAEHNERLVMISEDLLDKWDDKGLLQSLLHKEPLTGLRQVEIEHLKQEYRERIDKSTYNDSRTN